MPTPEPLSRAAFEDALTPVNLRGLQLVQLSILLVVSGLAFVVLVFYYSRPPEALPGAEAVALVHTLSLVHLVVALGLFTAVPTLYSWILRRTPRGAPPLHLSTPGQAFRRLRVAEIVRLSLLEVPALLGLGICLMAAFNDVLKLHPIYWLNTLSMGVLVGYSVLFFPTAAQLQARFEAHRAAH